MNTLNLIRKQIQKASALHDAQIFHTSYRGVEFKVDNHDSKETHGEYTYRGKTYIKWNLNLDNYFEGRVDTLPFFV